MCETRDLGSKWPQGHTLLSEEQVTVDIRVVCPQLLQRARMVEMDSQSMRVRNLKKVCGWSRSRPYCEERRMRRGQASK